MAKVLFSDNMFQRNNPIHPVLSAVFYTSFNPLFYIKTLDGIGREIETSQRFKDTSGSESLLTVVRRYFDANSNLIKEVDANNTQLPASERKYVSYKYSARDKMIEQTDREGNRTTYRYNSDNTISGFTGPRGNSGKYDAELFSMTYHYDDLKRLVRAEMPPKEPDGTKTIVTFVYDARGNLLERTEPDGGKKAFTYTPRNKVESESASGSGKIYTTRYEYDAAQNLKTIIDTTGNRTKNEYDNLNRLIKTILPEGNTQRYEYDIESNRTAMIDGNNSMTEITYSLYDKVIATKTAIATEPFVNFYDRMGNLTKTKDTLGNERYYNYDNLNRLVEETDEEGGLYTYRYDTIGNIIESSDPNGTTASYYYTPNYLVKEMALLNSTMNKYSSRTYQYDEEGFITSVNENGVISNYNSFGTTYSPDPYNRVKQEETIIDGRSFTTNYTYDEMDRYTGITYPNGKTVSYSYNQLGEVTGMPGYLQEVPEYDQGGRLTKVVAANGVTTEYSYDLNNRMTNLSYTGNAGTIKSYSYTYDNASNIIQKNLDTFKYDAENRLVEAFLKGSFAVHVEEEDQQIMNVYEDVLGQRRMEEVVDTAEVISFDYNAGSIGVDLGDEYEVTRIELRPQNPENRVTPDMIRVFTSLDNTPGSYREEKEFTANYSDDNRMMLEIIFAEKITTRFIKIKTDWNEIDPETMLPADIAEFKNNLDKMIKVYYNVTDRHEKYTYDAMGNRITETVTLKKTENRTHRYYPGTSRLMTNSRWTYVYDANGNVTEKGDTIFVNGTAVKVKDVDPTFWDTLTGSTQGISFTTEANGTHWQYDYDLMNRMIRVKKNDIDVAEYSYNWKGLRIKKERFNTKEGDVQTTYYVFSPNGKVLYEEDLKTGSTTANDFRQYVYLFGRLFAREDGTINPDDGSTETTGKFFYHTDHLGSVIAVTNADGELVWDNEFAPFGSAAEPDIKLAGGFRWASYNYDEDAELYYASARWMDPETGRFTSLDPIRDGMNWYVYCANNPMNFVDPSGLSPSGLNQGNSNCPYPTTPPPKTPNSTPGATPAPGASPTIAPSEKEITPGQNYLYLYTNDGDYDEICMAHAAADGIIQIDENGKIKFDDKGRPVPVNPNDTVVFQEVNNQKELVDAINNFSKTNGEMTLTIMSHMFIDGINLDMEASKNEATRHAVQFFTYELKQLDANIKFNSVKLLGCKSASEPKPGGQNFAQAWSDMFNTTVTGSSTSTWGDIRSKVHDTNSNIVTNPNTGHDVNMSVPIPKFENGEAIGVPDGAWVTYTDGVEVKRYYPPFP